MPGVEQARRLLEHAREITSEIYKFSLELTPDIHEAASRKLAYAKQVLESINKLTLNPDALTDTDLQDVIYQIIVSIRPNLIVAVDDLEKALQHNQYFQLPASEPRSQADILRELEASINLADLERQVAEGDRLYRASLGLPPEEEPKPPSEDESEDEAEEEEEDAADAGDSE